MTTAVQTLDFTSFIFANGEELKTTSLKIAEAFGKRHAHVIRDIQKIIKNIADLEHAPKFGLMSVDVEIGNGAIKKSPAYEMDKDGFMLVVMGYTGEAAMKIKVAYINAFNLMHAKLFPKNKYGLLESPTISKSQIGEIACRVDEIVFACEDGAKVKPAIWSRFKNHFRINGYKELSVDKFEEALAYLEKLRDEYASGKQMVLVDASELEKLKQLAAPSRADELLASPKLYTISEIVGIFNEIHTHDLAIVPKQRILALKKALENVF